MGQSKMTNLFFEQVCKVVRRIPPGKVATYGQIAALAGNRRGARQVVRILHACSRTDRLPWQRVVNAKGAIALAPGEGYEEQYSLLGSEGVVFGSGGRIDLTRFQWRPEFFFDAEDL